MTVKKLIEELKQLLDAGHADARVVTLVSEYGDVFERTVEDVYPKRAENDYLETVIYLRFG